MLKRYHRTTKMAEHKHGTMDITAQEQAFAGFIKYSIRVCYVILAIVIFMAVFNV
jgi:hypothetical protein